MDWKEGSSAKRRRVVVIGGGVGGSLIAKSLQFCADVTLVDLSMVEPMFGDRSLINHRDYLPNARVVRSKSIKITESEVSTADGRLYAFDYLVIATGHQDPVPTTKTERLKQFEADNQKIKSARSILIVGGGPVGVELASEIAIDSPDEKITLVHSGLRLIEFIGLRASEKTLDWLRTKNVDVKLDQLLEETFLKGNLDRFGRLKVDQCMRVEGRDNIFAVGDITDVQEIKQGCLAQKHAAGGEERKMAVYEPRSVKAIASLGRREALAQIPGAIKSKDLFIGKTRKLIGLKPDIAYS
ncbi:hypothetical protein EUGRSUZ_B03822 [Eucalyptus grandis]|uniref:Uncharacterized protein n=2 Tax=Eucalyptus grandis TaxID=71139 RepID=A0ACC3LXX9_EUCGR|nr:hypothetical protein EUGRSUZ_B03822 [Eucalyptus grandis]